MHHSFSNLRQPAGGFLFALIVANGDLQTPHDWQTLLAKADLIIAADGGAEYCQTLGILPNVLIGDLDSLTSSIQTELKAKGVRILAHPPEKNQTDFELALVQAKDTGAAQVAVFGGLGRRWDHSLANLLLAAQDQFQQLRITFWQGEQRILILRGTNKLDTKNGERISLLPMAGNVLGVTTHGLTYSLNDETLFFGGSRGVSNLASMDQPEVSIRQGVLLCIISPFALV